MNEHEMNRNEWQMFNHDAKLFKRLQTNRFYCSKCGHTVIMMPTTEKKMCTWCGTWVFRNKIDEFKYRVKERLNNVNQSR